jgi:quercetin dioxygenase-like cupin family protein
MMAAAHVSAIRAGMMPLGGYALSVALLAPLAWLPLTRTADTLRSVFEPICTTSVANGETKRPLGVAQQVSSKALPNVPGKRVTIVKVTYGPGGYTPPHHHAGSVTAYITAGNIRSQLAGGPIETFKVGESFFEPPGAVHLMSENASQTEPAELVAVFVADEGATLTIYHE